MGMHAGALIDAIDAGHVAVVRELVQTTPALARARDGEGVSAILHALYRGRRDMTEILCEAGPPLDIFEAAALGDLAQVRTMLTADPKLVHAMSSDGFTPLHLAAFFGQPAVVRELLGRGAPVDAVSENAMQVTPLHSAVAGGNAEATGALVEAGARVNVRQRHGWTPLHSVAQQGDTAMAQLLVKRGADPSARNDDGSTPARLAQQGGHLELARFLEQQSATPGPS